MIYKIVTSRVSSMDLTETVNSYLQVGWIVTGGLVCIEDVDGFIWAQAIIWSEK